MLLGTSCAVGGTGFLFHKEIIEKHGGWKYFLLTEDIQFTIQNVLEGEKIGYCETAMIYDEQPEKFSQSWKQRLRWAKGFIQVFNNYGIELIKNIFKKKSFACYDMTLTIIPGMIVTVATFAVNALYAVYRYSLGLSVAGVFMLIVKAILSMYGVLYFFGLVTTISEWDKIHSTSLKKIAYTFTFPIFMLTYIPIGIVALFKNVKWEQIEHISAKTIDDMRK